MTKPKIQFAGIYGRKSGWFYIGIDEEGTFQSGVHGRFADVINKLAGARLILVDMPIGLPSTKRATRICDAAAHKAISPRGSSIFPVPARSALTEPTYEKACEEKTRAKVRTKGKITFWKADKGYGFITPSSGAKQVFVHIKAFSNRGARPEIGQIVTFSLSSDNQGRPCAVRVAMADEKFQGEIKPNDGLLIILAASLFLVVVALIVLAGKMPVQVLLVYLVASTVTFVAYAMDKSAAQRGAWRTPESTLHGLALACGWPGAMIAQQTLRHKSRKEEFRFVFWLTVALNVGFFAWLLTESGSYLLQSLLG